MRRRIGGSTSNEGGLQRTRPARPGSSQFASLQHFQGWQFYDAPGAAVLVARFLIGGQAYDLVVPPISTHAMPVVAVIVTVDHKLRADRVNSLLDHPVGSATLGSEVNVGELSHAWRQMRGIMAQEDVDALRVGTVDERGEFVVGDLLSRPPGPAFDAPFLVDGDAAAERAESDAGPFPHGPAVGPVEDAAANGANPVRVGRVPLPGERVGVVVAVDESPPHVVPGSDFGDGVEPAVVDHRPQFVAPDPLVGPQPEIAELQHTLATLTGGQLRKGADPIQIAVRITSDQQTRRITDRARHLHPTTLPPRRIHTRHHDRALRHRTLQFRP
jgi:hypothetical protein